MSSIQQHPSIWQTIWHDWLVHAAQRWKLRVDSCRTPRRCRASLVNFVVADVGEGVVAGEKRGSVISVGVANDGAADLRRFILENLEEVRDDATSQRSAALLDVLLVRVLNLVVPLLHTADDKRLDVFENAIASVAREILPGVLELLGVATGIVADEALHDVEGGEICQFVAPGLWG